MPKGKSGVGPEVGGEWRWRVAEWWGRSEETKVSSLRVGFPTCEKDRMTTRTCSSQDGVGVCVGGVVVVVGC